MHICGCERRIAPKYIAVFTCAAVAIIVTGLFLYTQYNKYYGYTKEFEKISSTLEFSQILNNGSSYRVYEDDDEYLVLVKNNATPYRVNKSSGISMDQAQSILSERKIPSDEIRLEPLSMIVGNERIDSLKGYLYWVSTSVNSTKNRIIYIDFYTGDINEGISIY